MYLSQNLSYPHWQCQAVEQTLLMPENSGIAAAFSLAELANYQSNFARKSLQGIPRQACQRDSIFGRAEVGDPYT